MNTRNSTSDTTSTTSNTAPAATAAPAEEEITAPGAVEQYLYFRPMALQLPAEKIQHCRMDLSLVTINCQTGVTALVPYRERIATVAEFSLDKIDSMKALGQALLYTGGQVQRLIPTTGEIQAMMEKAAALRVVLLAKADVLVMDGIVPSALVAGIRKGRGAIDAAGDCVALAALFHQYASMIAGHVKVSQSDVQTANDLGVELLAVLRPKQTPTAADKDAESMSDMRDRMWTLFETTWEQYVWRAGAFVFGRAVEDHIPLLGSRVLGRRTPKSTPPEPVSPTPAPPAPVQPTPPASPTAPVEAAAVVTTPTKDPRHGG